MGSAKGISPLGILKQAINKVPALKFALGIAGIAPAIAIIKTLVTDLRVAVFGIVVMLFLMSVLRIFAKLNAIAAVAVSPIAGLHIAVRPGEVSQYIAPKSSRAPDAPCPFL